MHEGRSSSRSDDTTRRFRWRRSTAALWQLNEIAVSDRAGLEGLTQVLFVSPRVCQQTVAATGHLRSDMREGTFCAILIQTACKSLILKRRDVRVVEGARLESVCRGNSTVGSNPTLSAIRLRSRNTSPRATTTWLADTVRSRRSA